MLRRPCIFLPYGDLQAKDKFSRPPQKDRRGQQDINGPKFLETIANMPTGEEIEAELNLKVEYEDEDGEE
jgi:hypothetical protein